VRQTQQRGVGVRCEFLEATPFESSRMSAVHITRLITCHGPDE
jgi:hypothetical protein